MRVIAGIHRSRVLLGPEDDQVTRPITDRVKQSLFDRLSAMGALGGGAVLDIFAGTGSLGIEALSRGADHCTFVERDRSARMRLAENLAALKLMDQAAVLSSNAMAAGWLALLPHKPVGLIFLDPPYALTEETPDLARMMELIELLAAVTEPEGVLTLRTPVAVEPPVAAGWIGPASFPYGSMALHFYERAKV